MRNFCGALLIGYVVMGLNAQTPNLPNDFRQQNITEYNSSLLNPAYALDRNNPSSAALWARWQWQTYDADPTSLFFSYTHELNEASAVGAAFFQNNTGIFLNTGGAINYAYAIDFSPKVRLGIGLNLFAFQQKLADERFFQPNPIQTSLTDDVVLQLATGLNLRVDKFNIGFASENLFDYNITANERNTDPTERMFFGLASYDIPVGIMNADGKSLVRPALYFKSIPGFDTQYGFTSILTTEKFWVQGGYNSFYGVSGGIGGRFLKRFSVGALVEFGVSPELENVDPTFEIVTAYKFGSLTKEDALEEELIAEAEEKDKLLEDAIEKSDATITKQEEKALKRSEKQQLKQYRDSVKQLGKYTDVVEKVSKRELKRRADSIKRVDEALAYKELIMLQKQKQQDSLDAVAKTREEAIALAAKKQQDSLVAVAEAKEEAERLVVKNEVVQPKAGERYEEVAKEGSLAPGYYLIANVFGTKRYFDAFMADMKKRGIPAGSFYRDINKYNYVYLGRYTSISEARKARDSKLDGKYSEKTWIFRVTGE